MTTTDEAARTAITSDLASTLFVEAGAGSGKTTSLVGRFVALVLDGVDVTGIAAITFTEAAAAELRARIREAFEDIAAARPVRGVVAGPDSAHRAQAALADLDRATIATLHAFAQRILLSSPVEASLPPRVEVHDEISSALRSTERWRRFVTRLLDDESLDVTLRAALSLDIRIEHLEALAATLGDNWDLLVDLDIDAIRAEPITEADVTLSIEAIEQAATEVEALADTCTDGEDPLATWVRDEMAQRVAELAAVSSDPYRLLSLTGPRSRKGDERPGTVPGNKGKAGNWPDGGKPAVVAVWNEAAGAVAAERSRITDRVLRRLSAELADYTLGEARARQREGRLEFHDLLVLARTVLRSDAGVRRRLHDRYPRLLIDEFQDTDPIQVELAFRIAADPDHDPATPWDALDVEAGRLFFVGDPKQSIYRFRRADIDLFARAAAHHDRPALQLDTNFRTVAPIVDWCNRLFGHLIEDRRVTAEGSTVAEMAQPAYVDLHAARHAIVDDPGPPVLLLGGVEAEATAETLRAAEATDIVGGLVRAHRDGWLVHPKDEVAPRSCRWSDMTVLVPSRTSLPFLRRALDDAGVPYRLETGSLVYATTEIRDLLSVLRAIDDPGDAVAVIGALRSPAYGCGDDDLLAWYRVQRTWDYLTVDDDPDDDTPVAAAFRDLRDRHRRRPFEPVPELVGAVVRERALLSSSLVNGRHRDTWRLFRVVLEHARQFADGQSGGLGEFLTWAQLQADDKLRVTVPVLPEADVDAVRIMTIHGAKGLEFSITAVSGLSGQFPNELRGAVVRFMPDGGFDVRMSKDLETSRFDSRRTVEDVMGDQEGIRLLYVALTRARDHLIVSLHHKEAKTIKCHAHRIADALAVLGPLGLGVAVEPGTSSRRDDHDGTEARPMVDVAPVGAAVDVATRAAWVADVDQWVERRRTLLATATGGGAISATAINARLAPSGTPADDGEPDGTPHDRDDSDDLVPPTSAGAWRRGRVGTAVGAAVHAVLQHVDLDRPAAADIERLAARHAAMAGQVDATAEIAAKARVALGSELVRRAATASRHWKELHVGVPALAVVPVTGPVDVFEGFIDLVFESDDGLVIVDYKTDAVDGAAGLRRALDRYRGQGAAYAVALEAVVGRPVSEVHFLFLGHDDAVVATIDDLDAQKARVRAALAEVMSGASTDVL